MPPMTVCIAAICEEGKAAIMAADRSIAYSSQFFNSNGPDCKIKRISSKMVIAVASSPPGADFYRQFNQEELSKLQPKEIAEQVQNAMQKQLKKEVEINILAMRGNKWKSCDDYWIDTDPNNELIREQIRPEVVAYTLDTNLVLAGIGSDGARVYRIDKKAKLLAPDEPGYVAIGCGEEFAMGNLNERSNGIKNLPIANAIYFVYEAKKMAERRSRLVPKLICLSFATQLPR